MKIRQGFVSNSSSSSFIVAFPKKPKCEKDVQKMLFGDNKSDFRHPYNDHGLKYPQTMVAETIFSAIEDQKKPMTKEKMVEEINSGSYDGQPPYNYDVYKEDIDLKYHIKCAVAKKSGVKYKTAREKEDEKQEIAAKRRLLKFLRGCKIIGAIYHFSFSDNDSDYQSALEHGDVFVRVPHLQISHH